jgi:hypothetical protein
MLHPSENPAFMPTGSTGAQPILGGKDARGYPFRCECSRKSCTATIVMTLEEYARYHDGPYLLIVSSGHENPKSERIVQRLPGFYVIDVFDSAGRLL